MAQGLDLGGIKKPTLPTTKKNQDKGVVGAITGQPRRVETTTVTARLPVSEAEALLDRLAQLQETNGSRKCNKSGLVRAALKIALSMSDKKLNQVIKELP